MIGSTSPSLALLEEEALRGSSFLLEGLWSAPKAYLAERLRQKTHKHIVLVTGGVQEDRLFEDLSYFSKAPPLELPAWETLPGEDIAPSPDILGKRFEALHALSQKSSPSLLLCPLASLLQRLIPQKTLLSLTQVWKKGADLPFASLAEKLVSLGYRRAAVVSDKGEFALRGGILDLFPLASKSPVRLEFFGDTLESIRTFDPIGQKSVERIEEVFVCPASEKLFLDKEPSLALLDDYLQGEFFLLWDDLLVLEDAYVALKKIPAASSHLMASLEELFSSWKSVQHLFCIPSSLESFSADALVERERERHFQTAHFEVFGSRLEAKRFFHPFRKIGDTFLPEEGTLLEGLNQSDGRTDFLFLSETETDQKALKKELSVPARFSLGYLSSGFAVSDAHTALIPQSEFQARPRVRRQAWRHAYHAPAAEFHALAPGDTVVHLHSGIGRYLGMEKQVNHLGAETEFLVLQYAEGSKLFVPLSQSHLVSRYIGAREEMPALSQLGSKRWLKTKLQAQTQIVGYANDLLHMYAQRSIQGGFAFGEDSELLQEFEANFPYQATEDQELAIEAIKQDMRSSEAMDRLLCGDVGYGKTEVAMRAAFKAVADGKKQVAVLVPTTVLAMQHFETFSERMASFPIRLGLICRFHSAKQTKETLAKAAMGEIDILIGTHRLLSKDIAFQDLGLLIIDEEQRFGVRAKEHLKKLKIGIDCLSLSATPIPRTLYMSLIQIRPMSVLATPPQDRLPIKTILAETDQELVQNALLREHARGGQSFFIHNRVESIASRAATIQKWVPSLRIGIVHGQMDADAIDAVFQSFRAGEIDLLFATTLIENGIDVPNANTILIDRADTYGLADLYQLRGRVGRWNRAAYAYFLIQKHSALAEPARKRLHALMEASGYGGGMKVALRDLEIRGAGDLLGEDQSGQVSAIGFHLYVKLLKRAIESLKQKKVVSFHETKLEFPYDARLPESYIAEVSLRLELYHRFGEASSAEELASLWEEMQDRFGPPPEPARWLYHLARLRVAASARSLTTVKFQKLSLTLSKELGEKKEEQSFLLPAKVQSDPAALEEYVLPLIGLAE